MYSTSVIVSALLVSTGRAKRWSSRTSLGQQGSSVPGDTEGSSSRGRPEEDHHVLECCAVCPLMNLYSPNSGARGLLSPSAIRSIVPARRSFGLQSLGPG